MLYNQYLESIRNHYVVEGWHRGSVEAHFWSGFRNTMKSTSAICSVRGAQAFHVMKGAGELNYFLFSVWHGELFFPHNGYHQSMSVSCPRLQ